MIVLGADTHKRSHTVAVVAAATGELLGERTVPVGARGFGALLRWADRRVARTRGRLAAERRVTVDDLVPALHALLERRPRLGAAELAARRGLP